MTVQTPTIVRDRLTQTGHPTRNLVSAIPTALISDSLLLRSGLQHILQGTPFALLDPARCQDPAVEPALVIIEANQNTDRVLQTARQVREQFPAVRIVALADQFDLGFVRVGHDAGLNGFCLTATSPGVLIRLLELVMLGETVMPSAVLRSVAGGAALERDRLHQDNTAGPYLSDLKACKLSARETEILSCLREGAPNKVIARELDITEATIKVHVKAILRKIGAANRTQAAMWANQRLPQQGGASVNG